MNYGTQNKILFIRSHLITVIRGYAMKKDKDIFKDGKKGEEELLDFEFEELSEQDVEGASGASPSDEDIIELDDIVATGELAEDSESEEITRVLDGEEIIKKSKGVVGIPELDSAEPVQTAESKAPEAFEADLDTVLEDVDTSEFGAVETEETAVDFESKEAGRFQDGEEVIDKELGVKVESDSASDLDKALKEDVSEDLELDLDTELEGIDTSELDIVKLGGTAEESESEEIVRLLDSEDTAEEGAGVEEGADLRPDEQDQPSGADSSQVVEMQLDAALESLEASEKGESELELMESDLESVQDVEALDEDEIDIEGLAASAMPELEPELLDADITPELSHEDLSEVLEKPGEQIEIEEASIAAAAEVPIGISEEKIEAIITRVVQDVVEKVARETMTTVAEKLITEAIEALRESLELPPD